MNSNKKQRREKTVAQEYFEGEEIKRTILPEVQEMIKTIPEETYQQLLDRFDNDKLSLHSTVQDLYKSGIREIDFITAILTYNKCNLTPKEQILLAKLISYNMPPEVVKKGLLSRGIPSKKVDELIIAFSDLKYSRGQSTSSKDSPSRD